MDWGLAHDQPGQVVLWGRRGAAQCRAACLPLERPPARPACPHRAGTRASLPAADSSDSQPPYLPVPPRRCPPCLPRCCRRRQRRRGGPQRRRCAAQQPAGARWTPLGHPAAAQRSGAHALTRAGQRHPHAALSERLADQARRGAARWARSREGRGGLQAPRENGAGKHGRHAAECSAACAAVGQHAVHLFLMHFSLMHRFLDAPRRAPAEAAAVAAEPSIEGTVSLAGIPPPPAPQEAESEEADGVEEGELEPKVGELGAERGGGHPLGSIATRAGQRGCQPHGWSQGRGGSQPAPLHAWC